MISLRNCFLDQTVNAQNWQACNSTRNALFIFVNDKEVYNYESLCFLNCIKVEAETIPFGANGFDFFKTKITSANKFTIVVN